MCRGDDEGMINYEWPCFTVRVPTNDSLVYPCPILWFFLEPPPPIKTDTPMGCPPYKNEAPHLRNKSPLHWKMKPLSGKWFLEKNLEKLETVINTFSDKATLERDDRNSTRKWFYHLEQSKFCTKSETVC